MIILAKFSFTIDAASRTTAGAQHHRFMKIFVVFARLTRVRHRQTDLFAVALRDRLLCHIATIFSLKFSALYHTVTCVTDVVACVQGF